MRNALGEISGKWISGVVVKKGRLPARQVHLIVDDDTCSELFGDGYLGTVAGLAEVWCWGRGGSESVSVVVLDAPETEAAHVN